MTPETEWEAEVRESVLGFIQVAEEPIDQSEISDALGDVYGIASVWEALWELLDKREIHVTPDRLIEVG